MPTCTLMVLNWNGVDWLRKCLPSVVEAAAVANADVWIVDNESQDSSRAFCAEHFPSVHFYSVGDNLVLAAYNKAAQDCRTDTLFLLNNDVVLAPDCLPPLLRALTEETSAFSVAPCVRTFPPSDHAPIEMEAELPRAVTGALRGQGFGSPRRTVTRFTLGGAMLCWRDKYLELGGFDPLYFPGYSEDIDLCWRAWKRGWSCHYEPMATVYHAGGSTMGRSEKVRILQLRNDYLFHWKCLTTPTLRLSRSLATMPRLLGALAKGDRGRLQAFRQAVMLLPQVRAARARCLPQFLLDDVQVLHKIEQLTQVHGKLPFVPKEERS